MKEEITMMKIFAVTLFAMFACAGAANAGGGGVQSRCLSPITPTCRRTIPCRLAEPTGRACIYGAIRGSTIIGGRLSDVVSLAVTGAPLWARRSVMFQKL